MCENTSQIREKEFVALTERDRCATKQTQKSSQWAMIDKPMIFLIAMCSAVESENDAFVKLCRE